MLLNLFFRGFRRDNKKKPAPVLLNADNVSLANIPIFSSLDVRQVREIEKNGRIVEFKKGEIVYQAGEAPDGFYVVISGRFVLVGQTGKSVAIFSRGDYFGESSILAGRSRSAAVRAQNNGLVLKIEKDAFLRLLGKIPALSLHLSRTLGARLASGVSDSQIAQTKVIAVYAWGEALCRSDFSFHLSSELSASGRKSILISFREASDHTPGFFSGQAPTSAPATIDDNLLASLQEKIVRLSPASDVLCLHCSSSAVTDERLTSKLMGLLIEQYDFIVMDIPAKKNGDFDRFLYQADILYCLVKTTDASTREFEAFMTKVENQMGFMKNEIRLIGISGEMPLTPENMDRSRAFFSVIPERLYTAEEERQKPFAERELQARCASTMRYLGRELSGDLVGLALGCGAAFGFAHIGVIRVLEQENIPVDVIAGSSIGAVVGALWAAGYDSAAIEKIGKTLSGKSAFSQLVGLGDFSAPHLGFLKGFQISRFLRKYLGHRTFEDLERPLKIVATNLMTAEEVVYDRGDVVDAIRASISIPGILQPVKYKDQFLIDGGVVDPLPVQILNRYGAKKIIAVDVLPSSEDYVQYFRQFKERVNPSRHAGTAEKNGIWGKMRRLFKQEYRPNIFTVLMNTIQFMEHRLAQASAREADVVIHPILQDSHWAEFYSVEKFVQEGERQARHHLPEIKKLVEEN